MQQSGERNQETRQQGWEVQQEERTSKLKSRLTAQAQQMWEAKSSTVEALGQRDLEYELAHLAHIDEMSPTQKVNGQGTSGTWQPPMLSGVNLCQRDLSSRFLAHTDLRNAKLVGTNFSRANLSGACLSGADLSQADLSGVDLSGATLTGANFCDANLQNAVIIGANLLGACNLTAEQVLTAIRDSTTQLDIEVDITQRRLPDMRRNMLPSSAEAAPPEKPVPDKAVKRKQPPSINRSAVAVPPLLTPHKQNERLLFIVIFVTVFSITPLLVLVGANIGFSFVLGGMAALILAVLVARWPITGLYVIAGCVVLIEQAPLQYPILTDRLYIFYWPPNLEGFIERPIGLVLLFILLILVLHRLVKRQRPLWGGALFLPFLFFLLCVAFGVVHGLSSGGNLKIIVVEARPLWYLFVSYLLAYNLVTHKNHIRNILWIIIIGAGIKGIQGTYIYLAFLHGHLLGQNEIMAHEESFFFVAIILLVILFSLHYNYRPQLFAALLLLPCLLIALIANNRRADYIALLIGVVVAWALIFLIKPQARKGLAIGMIIFLALGGAYVTAFAHSSGSIAEPARAIVSVINPGLADARDTASNLYRQIENYDLKYTVKQNPLGLGFGKPFLQPEVLPNILVLDPYYLYVPHNTIYWIWMSLGPLGYIALWYLFGAMIVRGCLIARQLRDRYLQLVAIYIIAIVFMEIVVAFADYQLFFYRNVIYLGLLAGILMKLPALDEKKEQPVHEPAHSDRRFATSGVGSCR